MNARLGQKVPAADGSALATDVWLPDGPGPFPVLLTRTPYHRTMVGRDAPAFVERGYAYVTQDTRGKYDSTGTFRPLLDEAADGRTTLDWIANQKWCNGRIGMVGISYPGLVQVPAASSGHEALRCIAPAVAPADFFTDWIRYDGCFALANTVRWSMTHAVVPTQPATDHFAWEQLWSCPTLQDVFDRAGYRSPALGEWVEHDRYDDYWQRIDQRRMYGQVTTPGLHMGGWFDHLSRGQFQAYRMLRDGGSGPRARQHQRLMVGPWGHQKIGESAYGQWHFGPDAALSLADYRQRFVDLWLKDADDGLSDEPPVFVFVMGANRWVHFADWPVPGGHTRSWHLRSGGRANTMAGDGRLSEEPADGDPPDRFRYDPNDPVPTRGGPIYWGMEPVGPVDQRPILGRADVLYYRSDRLDTPMAVVGEINLDLWVGTTAADTDFIAKLCVVEPSGRVIVLTVGSIRCRYRKGWERCDPMPGDQPVPMRIQMGNLAYVFARGSRVAVMVTSSSFPRILPHPNTLAATWTEQSPQVATNMLVHDRRHPSRLLLPVVGL